jgi:redox-sensitive bicupin YhaK (pirin superfamily)
MSVRKIKRIIQAKTVKEGAVANLNRIINYPDIKDFDPFLMLDIWDSSNPTDYIQGFPWHPHRGMETMTYLINGTFEFTDTVGNKSTVSDGDCYWMTAGSGIIHQEIPQPTKRLLGTEFWFNLPREHKMTKPHFQHIKKTSIPEVVETDYAIKIISGDYEGIQGAVKCDYAKLMFLDVTINHGKQLRFKTEHDANVLACIVEGEGCFDELEQQIVCSKNGVLFHKGEEVFVKASKKGIRFFLFAARSIDEPIVWGGPMVMNTEEELMQTYQDLNNGTFVK